MTLTDPTLEQWHQGERRRAIVIGLQTVAIIVLTAAVVILSVAHLDNSRQDQRRACELVNVSRGETRTAIVEAIIVVFDEVADEPLQLTPVVEKVQDRLTESLPPRKCA
jgi:hypothetical protein